MCYDSLVLGGGEEAAKIKWGRKEKGEGMGVGEGGGDEREEGHRFC